MTPPSERCPGSDCRAPKAWLSGASGSPHPSASLTHTNRRHAATANHTHHLQVSVWWRTLCVRLLTLGPTLLVAVSMRGENSDFGTLTEWLNIVQSLVLPFVVIPVSFLFILGGGRKGGGRGL